MKFSVLMSIYHKEKPEYFNQCMQSIWNKQTIRPDEIVLVEDGKLTNSLYDVINKWQKKLGYTFRIVSLEQNIGLGDALNTGLQNCHYEIVARMDTDDIAHPERFEKQLKIFEDSEIDICSSWVSEFENNKKKIISYRKLPETHAEIISFAKKRNPINHPAVMYKKNIVQWAGGYQRMMWFEDYYLWGRIIMADAKFYNIQEPLVNMRAGYGQLERRSGWKYAVSEVSLQKEFLQMGFIGIYEFLRNISIRFISRILPKSLVKIIYRILRD